MSHPRRDVRRVSATVCTDMRIRTLGVRIPDRVAFWALTGVALLLSHDAIFLIQLGPGESLARILRAAGHDYWGVASLALVTLGVAAATRAALRIHALRRRAATLGVARPRRIAHSTSSRLLSTWLRLFAIVAIGFAIQENLEHLAVHGHAIGLGALLGPEYPLAIPAIGLISGVAALIAAVVGTTEQALLAVIAKGLRTFGRAPRSLARPPMWLAIRRISPIARSLAGRAPPLGFISPH